MEKAKILMLCSHKDTPRIQRLMDKLNELGIHAELPKEKNDKCFERYHYLHVCNSKTHRNHLRQAN